MGIFGVHFEGRSGGNLRSIPGRVLFISPTGNDITGNGSQGAPWQTLEFARATIQGNGWNTQSQVTVNLLPGTYYNTAVTFTPADNGLPGLPATYQAFDGPDTVVLSGGQRLTNWTLHSGNIWKCPLASPIYTLTENGVRARKARLPKLNPGVNYPCAFAPYFTAAGVNNNALILQYNPVDFNPAGWNLPDVSVFSWSVLFNIQLAWFTDTHGVTFRDTVAHQFTLDHAGVKFYNASGSAGSRYFVQGDLSMLTEAGEFVYSGGFVYYWPRNTPIGNQTIVSPTTKRVLSFVGNSTTDRCAYINVDSIGIEDSDFNSWYQFGLDNDPSYLYWQNQAIAQNGLIYAENIDHITVTRCHLKNAGFAGIFAREYCQNNSFVNNWIEHVGTDGIVLEGRAPGAGDIIGRNKLDNNIVNNFGELAGNGMGIEINQSANNTVFHGEIFNGPRNGIRVTGWVDVTPDSDMYTRNNSLKWLRVRNTNQDSGEAGSIGLSFFNRTGVQTVDQCIVDNIHAHPSMTDFSGGVNPWGVFCDNESDGQHLSNIQVTNTQGNQFFANDSSTHVLTNCSFLANGLPNPSFNPALMDTANIGVTTDNPYKTEAGV